MEVTVPSELLAKEKKEENTLRALPWQFGHGAFSSAELNDRRSSNFRLHPGQRYS